MAATEGEDPPVAPPPDPAPAVWQGDVDCVITTVVAGSEDDALDTMPPMDLEEPRGTVADVPEEMLWMVGELTTTRKAAQAQVEQLAALEDRLAKLEAVPGNIDALGRATRQELERCAGVLFGHDRALNDSRDRFEALAARLGALEGRAALSGEGPPLDERVLAQLEGFQHRLVAMEARVEPLEPVPTVVQALRRAVRASDDLLAGEVAAREREVAALAGEIAAEAQAREDAMRRGLAQDLDRVAANAAGQAEALAAVAGRVAAAEARLAPLDAVPADIEALSRILRRELDAVTADNQARDQMLRRALQNEIDQLHAASEAREQAAAETVTRLAAVEGRLQEAVDAHAASSASAAGRLDALEARATVADGLGAQLEALRELVRTGLDRLQADVRAHDQVMGEITRTVAALDARLARFDAVPGELQSLRTAVRQESERYVSQLRVVEERVGQLAWVPGDFQEARKRILALTSGLQAGQDSIRSLETGLASTNEGVKALAARLGAGVAPEPPA